MRKFKIVLIVFICVAQNLFSQDEKAIGRSLELHTMPLTLINSSPRFRFGIEYNVGPKLGYTLEVGAVKSLLKKGMVKDWSGGKDYSFFEIRPEIKYYFYKAADNYSSLYCATELFFILKKDLFERDSYYLENSYFSYVLYDEARMKKVKYGIHFKGGIKQLLFKRFDLDLYGGIGIAYRKIDYSNVINPFVDICHKYDEIIPQYEKHEGESVIFHATFGCKIGYILFRK